MANKVGSVPLSRRNLELWKEHVMTGTPVASSTAILPFFIGKLRCGHRALIAYTLPAATYMRVYVRYSERCCGERAYLVHRCIDM